MTTSEFSLMREFVGTWPTFSGLDMTGGEVEVLSVQVLRAVDVSVRSAAQAAGTVLVQSLNQASNEALLVGMDVSTGANRLDERRDRQNGLWDAWARDDVLVPRGVRQETAVGRDVEHLGDANDGVRRGRDAPVWITRRTDIVRTTAWYVCWGGIRDPLDRGLRNPHRPARDHSRRGRGRDLLPTPLGRSPPVGHKAGLRPNQHRTVLLVVLADALDGRDYVVTARDMTDTERRAFTEKGR
jgi:hypothetical protein